MNPETLAIKDCDLSQYHQENGVGLKIFFQNRSETGSL